MIAASTDPKVTSRVRVFLRGERVLALARRLTMTRHWPHALVSLGLLCAAFGVACGGSNGESVVGADAGRGHPKDAGANDSTAAGDDSSFGDDAAGDDASGDATLDGSNDDASGDEAAAGQDAPSDGADDAGADGSPDAGATPEAGASDGGDGGEGTEAGTDASTPDASTPDAAAPDASPGTGDGGTCDFAGTWASQITIDVNWAAGGIFDIVIAPGSGTIKQWLLSTRTQSGTSVTDTAVVCGIQLPDFQGNAALVNETYGIRFPNGLFDGGGLSNFQIHGTVSGSTSTATYTTPSTAVLLGLTLANPATAVWPATVTTEVDEDGDSKPGITANVAQGGGFSNVPLDFSVIAVPATVPRSDRLYVAIRQVTSISAQFSDCDHSAGSVTVPQITDPSTQTKKYAIDSHVVGCGVAGGNADCSATQTTFVDNNQPVFVPTATNFVSARVANGATCAAVRSQFQ